LLGIASQTLAQGRGNIDVPADAKNLPLECQDILFDAGVTNEFKASKMYNNKFHVALKISTSAQDAKSVLTLPALAGVKPTHSYDKPYDKGFVAPLTYTQACALDKDPRVGQTRSWGGGANGSRSATSRPATRSSATRTSRPRPSAARAPPA
jgi:hypothetical protein